MKQTSRIATRLLLLLMGITSATHAQRPQYTLRTATTQALQAMIDRAPATGAYIICPPGQYIVITKPITVAGKSNLTIAARGLVTWVNASREIPTFVANGSCQHIRLTGIRWTSRIQSTTTLPNALLQTYETARIDGFEIDHCYFTTAGANQNAVGFRPYSPRHEQGVGRGHMLRRVAIHHCVFENVGRMGVELTSHVHADGLATVYYQDFTFANNRGTNLGRLDGYNGMLLFLSGIGKTIRVTDNTVTDARFAGLEFVACQDVMASNNRFNSTGATTYSAYTISQAGSLRAQRISISGGGGYLKGRPFVLYGTDGFTVRGGTWKSEQPTDIRATNGLFTGVRLQVTTGSEAGGGNALQLHQCTGVTVANCILTLSSGTQTNYSVVDFGPASNNTRCQLINNTLKRPSGALDAFVHTELNHTIIVSGNSELN